MGVSGWASLNAESTALLHHRSPCFMYIYTKLIRGLKWNKNPLQKENGGFSWSISQNLFSGPHLCQNNLPKTKHTWAVVVIKSRSRLYGEEKTNWQVKTTMAGRGAVFLKAPVMQPEGNFVLQPERRSPQLVCVSAHMCMWADSPGCGIFFFLMIANRGLPNHQACFQGGFFYQCLKSSHMKK